MDFSTEKYTSDVNRADSFSAVWNPLLGIVRWLIEIFTLTEADRMKAGIYIRRRGA